MENKSTTSVVSAKQETSDCTKPRLAAGLSWNDALYAMHEGKTVIHRYFSGDEKIYMENGKIVLDGKYHVTPQEFIKWRNTPDFLDGGWEVVSETCR